ncbi:hypothetical protein A243_22906 [Pseudomonas syringae pv. actinidiae ICMP 18883]|nr:hypothetical protein A246_22951 [Pseudomonas syringae pv. actinidiae ICMP 19098]EPN31615.1 hypothetical protein A243_22906 [Pseudomonas syringae pv. actinidiae ICMP 18883]EPN47279.1 hypothetical protein A241_28571 [Pseudomonas syringae pv. actinidiae ICMP 19094]
MLDDAHPFFFTSLLSLYTSETLADVALQQAPDGIRVGRIGLVTEVAETKRQPIAAAQALLFDPLTDLDMDSAIKLLVLKNGSYALAFICKTGKNHAPL